MMLLVALFAVLTVIAHPLVAGSPTEAESLSLARKVGLITLALLAYIPLVFLFVGLFGWLFVWGDTIHWAQDYVPHAIGVFTLLAVAPLAYRLFGTRVGKGFVRFQAAGLGLGVLLFVGFIVAEEAREIDGVDPRAIAESELRNMRHYTDEYHLEPADRTREGEALGEDHRSFRIVGPDGEEAGRIGVSRRHELFWAITFTDAIDEREEKPLDPPEVKPTDGE